MTTKEILIAARNMIAKPRGWTKGTLENEHGAVCAVGAIRKAANGGVYANEPKGVRKLLNEVVGGDIVGYNDTHSKKCVVAAFDTAIERES